MADASVTRTKILNACRALLEGDAGAATRMGDVAKAAGVSRQAVYLHLLYISPAGLRPDHP